PAVTSAAREAADNQAQKIAQSARQQPVVPPQPAAPAPAPPKTSSQPQQGGQGSEQQGAGTGTGGGRPGSAPLDLRTHTGGTGIGTSLVPKGRVFRVTALVLANFQGDEGLLTIAFGQQKIGPFALETFRNQDYHWVTPIDIPGGSTVTATVSCAKPGTPATGRQATNCHEVLNATALPTLVPT